MFSQCFNSVSTVFQQCLSSVAPVSHHCLASVLYNISNVSLVCHQCVTSVLLVFHQCFTRDFIQPKLKSGQALLSKIGTILQLNRDNSGHISLLLPNLSQSTSYQSMKISKIRTKSGQIETKKRKVVQKCMKIANVPIFSPKYSKFGTKEGHCPEIWDE